MDAERAVANLIAEYAEAIDAGDFEAVADLLAHAVVGAVGDASGVRGREAVLDLYRRTTRRYPEGTPRTRHVTSNLWIEVDDQQATASARSYYTVFQATEGLPLQPVVSGGYRDTFERRGASWRFSERRFTVDLVGNLAHHLLGAPDRPH